MPEVESELVLSAFEKFTEASAKLQLAYGELSTRFQSLSAELEATNVRLTRTVAEKERIGLHLRAVLESLESGVLVADAEGRITHRNRALLSLLSVPGLGSVFDTLADLGRARPELVDTLSVSGPEHREIELGVDGAGVRTLEVERRPLAAVGESCRGWVFVIRDLTRLRDLERQAKQMERLAAMGEMALQLAHEIRNPLGSILLHASLLRDERSLSPEGRRSVEQLEVGVRSLDNVVSNMRSFREPAAPEMERVDLRHVVAEAEAFLEPLTRERRVRVRSDFSASSHAVELDRGQFRQVLVNLWLNALRAMPGGGLLEIATRDGAERGVVLEFRDDGPGIALEILPRVFDPFFTTDRTGTGLGLAVAAQIVRQHKGAIHVTSAVGSGTTFVIELPAPVEEPCAVASW